jgi:hypothetical protein
VKRLRGGVLVSAEDNKAVIRRLVEEVYNEGRLGRLDYYYYYYFAPASANYKIFL